ncbi:MAG: ABC transporter permease [Cyclobacteriaceae bacterium]
MLKNYLKIAWRNLVKHKVLSLINIAGLTIGVTTCILISLYVIHELNYDNSVPDGKNMYRVLVSFDNEGSWERGWSMPAPMAGVVDDIFEEAEQTGRIMANNLFYGAGSNEIKVQGRVEEFHETGFAYADQSIIDMFQFEMVYGDPSTALSEPNTMVISEKMARKFFNDINPVGQFIILNGDDETPRRITGVMEDFPTTSHLQYDYFLTLSGVEFGNGEQTRWTQNNYFVYVKLRSNTNVAQFEKKFSDVIIMEYIKPAFTAFNKELGSNIEEKAFLELQPLKDIHLHSGDLREFDPRGDIKIVQLFAAIAIFILLIACVNYINLTTAKSANRAPEIGLRKVIGSQRNSLINQFLIESFIVTLIVFTAGLLFASLLLPYFNDLAAKSLAIPWSELWFLPSLFAGVVIVGIVSGLYPAFYLSGFYPIQILKGNLAQGVKSKRFRTVLVVFQFSISAFLIVGTLVIYRQMNFILNKKVGFEKDQVIQILGTNMLGEKIDPFKEELKNSYGVVNVSISDYLPVEGTKRNGNSFFNEDRQEIDEPVFGQSWIIDEDYINTMGMNLLAGRTFSNEIASDDQSVIINQTMAKKLGLDDPVGKVLMRFGQKWNIIGLVEDFNFRTFKQEVEPLAFFYGKSQSMVSVKISAENIPMVLEGLENVWKDFVPNSAFRYSFMNESYARMYDNVYRTQSVFTNFAGLAVFISCLGLFALSAFLVDQRKKELSIRKTLGASVQTIFRLVTSHFIGLVGISILIAAPISYLVMERWLEDYVYKIDISWDIFAWAGFLTLLTALLTISYHAIKSALVNPAENLRTE